MECVLSAGESSNCIKSEGGKVSVESLPPPRTTTV